MFVMDYYGHKLSNGVLFAHHLILDAPGGSSHLGYRRRVPLWHNPNTRVNFTDRTGYGAVRVIWPYMAKLGTASIIESPSVNYRSRD